MHLNMSHSEVRRLPVRYRHWYLDRLAKHFKDQKEAMSKRSSPDSRNEQSQSENLNKLAEFEKQMNSKFT